jgi:hypothetical protein
MFGLGDSNYSKKAYKIIVYAGDYCPPLFGPGEKDAPPPQWKII